MLLIISITRKIAVIMTMGNSRILERIYRRLLSEGEGQMPSSEGLAAFMKGNYAVTLYRFEELCGQS
jgi:hypothetical protein